MNEQGSIIVGALIGFIIGVLLFLIGLSMMPPGG